MKDWIVLNRHSSPPAQTQKIKGVDVTVFGSPHNVPCAVRCVQPEDSGIFRIEFQYIDGSEPTLTAPRVSKDGMVSVFRGRQSGRIGRIDVIMKGLEAQHIRFNIGVVGEEVERSLSELQESETTLSHRLNFDAARTALHENRKLLHA